MPRSRSIATRSDAALARGPALLFATLLLLPGVALAQKAKVAVLPLNAPSAVVAKKVQIAIARALASDYEIVPIAQWDASAQKLFAQSHSADDLAAVANDLGVAVVITGAIKNEEGWNLIVTVRAGPTGK